MADKIARFKVLTFRACHFCGRSLNVGTLAFRVNGGDKDYCPDCLRAKFGSVMDKYLPGTLPAWVKLSRKFKKSNR